MKKFVLYLLVLVELVFVISGICTIHNQIWLLSEFFATILLVESIYIVNSFRKNKELTKRALYVKRIFLVLAIIIFLLPLLNAFYNGISFLTDEKDYGLAAVWTLLMVSYMGPIPSIPVSLSYIIISLLTRNKKDEIND